MAEHYYMFDSVDGDREYTAQDFADYFNELLTTGVFYRNNQPSLRATRSTGLNTQVDIGAAYVEGYVYRNTSSLELLHAAGHASYPRIDRIVIRLDKSLSNRYVRAFIKEGTPASSPQPPSLERNDMVYEISLARVRVNAGASTIASIVDDRLNQSVCGVVSSIIEVPTDVFVREWDSFYTTIVQQVHKIVSDYEKTIDENTDAANQSLSDYVDQLQSNIDNYEEEFREWFDQQQNEGVALGGMKISVQSNEPTAPNEKDIWIDLS